MIKNFLLQNVVPRKILLRKINGASELTRFAGASARRVS